MNQHELYKSYNFSDRTVVVTGGMGVLGREMVQALVGCRANVAVIDRDTQRAEALLKEIDSTRGRLIIVRADVLDPDLLQTAAEKILQESGGSMRSSMAPAVTTPRQQPPPNSSSSTSHRRPCARCSI